VPADMLSLILGGAPALESVRSAARMATERPADIQAFYMTLKS
jgi:hypothetical protein